MISNTRVPLLMVQKLEFFCEWTWLLVLDSLGFAPYAKATLLSVLHYLGLKRLW